MYILKKLFFGYIMLLSGAIALFGVSMIIEAFSAWGSHGLAELMGYVSIVALFGWICRKSFSAFRAKPNSSGFSRIAMEPRKRLDEGLKFKIKMAVCLVAIVAGLVMAVSGDKDLLEAGVPLAIFGLIFAFGFSHGHKKRMKQENEIRERDRIQAAIQASIDRVSAMTTLPMVNSVSVVLRPGEICHYQEAASVLQVKNEVVGHTSGSAGVSVRVAKGLTLHSGGSRGHAIRQNVAHLHPGYLTITNQRFVMTGDKGFDHPLSKLTAMTPYNGYEGITLQFGRSVYTVIMDEPFIVPKIWELMKASVQAPKELILQRPTSAPMPAPESEKIASVSFESVDTEVQVPTPRGAEISYLDAEALRFWSKKHTNFQIPAYYADSTFGRNAGPARERLLKGRYLDYGDDRKRIALKKVPELKAILADRELKVSGSKKELVQRILDNFDEDEIEDLFPARPYVLTEKGKQALVPYEIIHESEAHGLDFSHYRLMKEKDAHPDDEDHAILTRMLSEDIQECYKNRNLSSFQITIMKAARFMREIGEPERALECYCLSFLVWMQDVEVAGASATHPHNFYLAKNLEQVGVLCGYSFEKVTELFREYTKKSNPFGLATDDNIDQAIETLRRALRIKNLPAEAPGE